MIDNSIMASETATSFGKVDNHKGLRYNQGKLRYDLINAFANEQLVKVLTMGSQKYADRNWEKGMKWSDVIASLKRHLAEIEKCEDFDSESGMLHAAHLSANSHFLTAYYQIYPQGDDRPHAYLNQPKIGLDIDEVLCDWITAWCNKFGYTVPYNWNFSYNNKEHFESMSEKEVYDFYMSIPVKIKAKDLPFEPHCYITSRRIPVEYTKEWLSKNGFSTVPVYSIGWNESKVEVAKQSGIDWFVDDRYENFVELNNAGICTFLIDAKHNQKYNVGYKRIYSLNDLLKRF